MTQRSIGMNFLVGSVTSYDSKKPSFNIMYMDPDTMLPVDYETHTLDLDYANEHDKANW